MEAMVFAAGEGTRLRPLTDTVPKALVPVHGRPLLGHVLDRLVEAGATRIVVNTCRFGEQVEAYVAAHPRRGVEIVLSPEPDGPYDTGGGLLAAAKLFRGDGPILVHNVDVLSAIPLDALLAVHRGSRERGGPRVIATLGVQDRGARRQLLFDAQGLAGWESWGSDGMVLEVRQSREPMGPIQRWSFSGVQVVEPAMLELPYPEGPFSMVAWYLELVELGYHILPVDVSHHAWYDVGTPERLAAAERGSW